MACRRTYLARRRAAVPRQRRRAASERDLQVPAAGGRGGSLFGYFGVVTWKKKIVVVRIVAFLFSLKHK